jgi:hypothetical protein
MDQFKNLYHEYCKTYHVEPNELLLGEIQKYKQEFYIKSKDYFSICLKSFW